MKISGIRSYSPTSFNGENSSKKANAAKTAAGAAMIAMATAIPAQEADAQIYYPYVPHSHYYYVPTVPSMSVPECFVYGDMENYDYDKSMNQVFSEVDGKVAENRELSLNEVVQTEKDNWNMNNLYPFNSRQRRRTIDQFKTLSELYNERGSNPKTISYSEYKKIMNDYMKEKNVANFMILMDLLTRPRPHYHRHLPPPPHHHHHHY